MATTHESPRVPIQQLGMPPLLSGVSTYLISPAVWFAFCGWDRDGRFSAGQLLGVGLGLAVLVLLARHFCPRGSRLLLCLGTALGFSTPWVVDQVALGDVSPAWAVVLLVGLTGGLAIVLRSWDERNAAPQPHTPRWPR